MKRTIALLLISLAVLMAGCVALPEATLPEARTFVSPVQTATRSYRYFIPMWAKPLNKLGLAGCPATCQALGCAWCYSWGPEPGGTPDAETVPMLWGANDVGKALGGNSPWLLGFNEPDLSNQANLTPEQAAALWRQVETLYPGRKLVSPAPSHFDVAWLGRFRDAYAVAYGVWPRLDALAFHCYWSADECIAIGEQFVAWAAAWGVPEVWCTEFAFVPAWAADAEADARRFVAWAEAEPTVTRYAPFVSHIAGGEWYWPDARPEANPSVFAADGMTLTEIGKWYAKPWAAR